MYYQHTSHGSKAEEDHKNAPNMQLIYSSAQKLSVDMRNIPRHIAIIPDGNRRWARRHLFQAEEGHREGGEVLLDVIKGAKELGVEALTVYGLSTENWNRPFLEIKALLKVIESLLRNQCEEMVLHGVKLHTIGDLERLPPHLKDTIAETKAATSQCDQIDIILALNYGGRDEIRRAILSITEDCLSNKLKVDQITENVINKYLDTAAWPDPDLLIRTGGESRISNFLLWQLSYTEVYVERTLWPDFTPQHFLEAIINYQQRERRLGGI